MAERSGKGRKEDNPLTKGYKKSSKTGPRKVGNYGGFRLPTEATLDRYNQQLSEVYLEKIRLLKTKIPKQVVIYGKDLKLCRAIGGGNWRVGFYHALRTAHELHTTTGERQRLARLDPTGSNARAGLLYALELVENLKEEDRL